jgi:hypothetical protein
MQHNSSAFTAFKFVMQHAERLHGERALLRKSKLAPAHQDIHEPTALLKYYNIKGVREDSHLGLLNWLNGTYPLELRLTIPSPQDMLEAQCGGRRFVTMLARPEEQFQAIGRHAGPYEFLLHDLEHAHKFFGGEFQGQVRFFNLLRVTLEKGAFSEFENDTLFAKALDYLMADMNSHPVHMLKYLKAILLEALQRSGRDHDTLLRTKCRRIFALWNLPPAVTDSAMRINHPLEETGHDRVNVSQFFVGVSV